MRIRIRMKRTAEDIIEIGRDLISVKERLGHGQFLPWIEAEFGMGEHSARNFMRVAEKFGGQIENYSRFSPTVLIAMATAPPDVITQVEAKAAAGEDVSVAEIARLKAEHKAKETALAQEAASAKALAATKAKELEDLQKLAKDKAAAASRRETNLIAEIRPQVA